MINNLCATKSLLKRRWIGEVSGNGFHIQTIDGAAVVMYECANTSSPCEQGTYQISANQPRCTCDYDHMNTCWVKVANTKGRWKLQWLAKTDKNSPQSCYKKNLLQMDFVLYFRYGNRYRTTQLES